MKIIAVLSLSFLLASCFSAPQSRVEFVGKIKQGAGLSSYKTITVNRSMNSVLGRLNRPMKNCLNVQVKSYWARGGVRTSNIVTRTYTTNIKQTSNKNAELTLQTSYDPMTGSKPPKGGFYDYAIDFESIGKNKTKVVMYSGMSGQGDITDAFTKWVNGKKASCPLTKGAK